MNDKTNHESAHKNITSDSISNESKTKRTLVLNVPAAKCKSAESAEERQTQTPHVSQRKASVHSTAVTVDVLQDRFASEA